MQTETIIWGESGCVNGQRYSTSQSFVLNDGGRELSGFKGSAGDCVVRAIAIATNNDYKEVYNSLFQIAEDLRMKNPSPRNGVDRKVYDKYMKSIGWSWIPTMKIGSGCQVHVRHDELPGGRLILRASRHLIAMIDGVIHDTYDSSRGGTRCVYGYFTETVS